MKISAEACCQLLFLIASARMKIRAEACSELLLLIACTRDFTCAYTFIHVCENKYVNDFIFIYVYEYTHENKYVLIYLYENTCGGCLGPQITTEIWLGQGLQVSFAKESYKLQVPFAKE